MIAEDTIVLGSLEEFFEMLADMIEPIKNPKIDQTAWEECIALLQEMERGFFASSAGPDGEPWAPLKPSTVQKKGHSVILRETWDLMNSLTGNNSLSVSTTTPTMLEFGTSRPWAFVHQEGDMAGRIPARPFIGMSQEGLADVVDLVADAAVKMMFEGYT